MPCIRAVSMTNMGGSPARRWLPLLRRGFQSVDQFRRVRTAFGGVVHLDNSHLNRIRIGRRDLFISLPDSAGRFVSHSESDSRALSCDRFQVGPFVAADRLLTGWARVIEIAAL